MKKRSLPQVPADEHFIRLRQVNAPQILATGWGFEITSKRFHEYILPDEMRGVINIKSYPLGPFAVENRQTTI
jgi:hypothetical protein